MTLTARLPFRSRFAVFSLSIALTGCGLHPLPEDVSGVTTFDIVERIRCEAQEGLWSFQDEEAWRIAAATTIGMRFTFEMATGTSAGVSALEFDKVTPTRHLALDITAGSDFARSNTRAFRVVEQLTDVSEYNCLGKQRARNLAHPITGTIGLAEVVRTYIQLEKQGNLQKKSDTMFSDSLVFTTNYSAGWDATWGKSAVPGRVTLTKLSVGAGGHRNDTHRLHITLTRDALGPVGSGAAQKARLKELIDSESIRDPRAQVALVQKESDARIRTVLELERLRVLSDDDRVATRVLGQRMLDILKLP